MKKFSTLMLLWLLPILATAQNYPSPTYNNVTINGTATIPNANVTGGAISGTPISGSAGAFTTLNASGAATLNNLTSSNATITGGTVGGTTLATNSALAPHVANLTSLQAMSTANSSTYIRDGYTSAGDGGAATYVSSGSACSLNGGSGDNGSQVKSADGKCW